MAKAELKTRETDASVEDFLNAVDNEERRSDAFRALEIFKRLTGEEPKMWGPAIVGFGKRVLKYPDGRELDWPLVAFSPRKANLVLYIADGYSKYDEYLEKLGKHSTGRSCLYIKRLSDVDEKVLTALIKEAVKYERKSASSC